MRARRKQYKWGRFQALRELDVLQVIKVCEGTPNDARNCQGSAQYLKRTFGIVIRVLYLEGSIYAVRLA